MTLYYATGFACPACDTIFDAQDLDVRERIEETLERKPLNGWRKPFGLIKVRTQPRIYEYFCFGCEKQYAQREFDAIFPKKPFRLENFYFAQHGGIVRISPPSRERI